MTLVDLIKLGLVETDGMAEKFAESLVDSWHNGRIEGELKDVLGLTSREYQAWTTGDVSLLTIARWQKTSHPPLDAGKPWFKLSGKPPHEVVGYLESRTNGPYKPKRRSAEKNSDRR